MNDSDYWKGACLQCGGHIEFPTQAAGTQIDCPHCGWATVIHPFDPSLMPPQEAPATSAKPNPRPWRWAAAAALISIATGTALYFKRPGALQSTAATNDPVALDPAPAVPIPEGLAVSPVKLETTRGTSLVHARGTVENRSGRPRYGLKVEVRMLDARGATLGLGTDYLDVLEPGASRGFKVLVIDPKTSRATLHLLTEQE